MITEPTTTRTPEVIRAEERLRVDTVARVRERVRLHKRVVTEEVTRTATVAREILDIEHLPAEPNAEWLAPIDVAHQTTDIEIVLHEERVTMTTVVVPVERVRVRIHRIAERVEIAEVLRREEIEVVPLGPNGSLQRSS